MQAETEIIQKASLFISFITVDLHGSKTVLAFVFYKSNSYIEK
jgi:hypothetical protein